VDDRRARGVNVCLRRFDAKTVFDLIRNERITHYCGAPIVQSAIANAPAELRAGIDHRCMRWSRAPRRRRP
jgi:fatty-acyl-CoA synthase